MYDSDSVGLAAAFVGTFLLVARILNGLIVFKYLPEGTGRFNDLWMAKKLITVETMQCSTMRIWIQTASMGMRREMTAAIPSSDLVMCGGGFPIPVKGCGVIGAIAVSGPGDQNDHEFVVEALRRFQATASL